MKFPTFVTYTRTPHNYWLQCNYLRYTTKIGSGQSRIFESNYVGPPFVPFLWLCFKVILYYLFWWMFWYIFHNCKTFNNHSLWKVCSKFVVGQSPWNLILFESIFLKFISLHNYFCSYISILICILISFLSKMNFTSWFTDVILHMCMCSL